VADLLLTDGTVVTMNANRDIVTDSAIVVENRKIVDVGPTDRIESEYTAPERIDASGHAVLPGFIDTHVHVSGVLLRGLGNYRNLHDWLINVKRPGTSEMTADDHAVAAAHMLYERAVERGLGTPIENIPRHKSDDL